MWEPVTFISDIEQQKERTQKGRTEEKNKLSKQKNLTGSAHTQGNPLSIILSLWHK